MNWPKEVTEKLRRLTAVKLQLKNAFVGRDEAVDLLVLATLCREHLLLIGPPGTAKTELITHYTKLVDAAEFHYLLTRFTEPSELFGPLDLAAFQKGKFQIHTQGMLPHAEIAFLDEVFQGSSAILNSLLALVNERVFHNGSTRQPVPLVTLIGASNTLPDDFGLHAFADRFLLRLQLEPTPDAKLGELIDTGWQREIERIDQAAASGPPAFSLANVLNKGDLARLQKCVGEVDVAKVTDQYSELIRGLRTDGVALSDRRIVRSLKLVAAAALLREATEAGPVDFWPLKHVWTRPDEAEAARALVDPVCAGEGKITGDGARKVEEILRDLEILLAQPAAARSEVALGAHLMRLNELRREILKHHREEKAARERVEGAIRLALKQLEGT